MARLHNLTERGLDTQRLLSEALIELSLEKGYPAVTIRDITERTGVDRTTFYLHFKDKDSLVVATQRRMLDELIAGASASENPLGALTAFFNLMNRDRKAWLAILGFDGQPRFERRFIEYFSARLDSLRLFAKPAGNALRLPRGLVARFVAGTVRGCALWWLQEEEPRAPSEMAEITMSLITGGLG